ncbi:MAG: hypothetical protein WCO56_29660 [Verrucomicrobiota bacterium]
MENKLIVRSEVDLIEVHLVEGGVFVLEITDYGHGMSVDRRVIPASQVDAIVQNLHDREFCERLSKNRGRLKPYELSC